MLYRLIVTAALIVLTPIVQWILKSAIGKTAERNQLKASRARQAYKIAWTGYVFLVILALISVWGVDLKNIWIVVTGVIGVIAIGFFAMWSLLSNIIAGVFLFLFHPFRVDDEIVILPENVQGTVVDITTVFIVLEDADGHMFQIPNSLCFQRFVKVLRSPQNETFKRV